MHVSLEQDPLETAVMAETVMRRALSPETSETFGDHVVGKSVLLPGVAYQEIALVS